MRCTELSSVRGAHWWQGTHPRATRIRPFIHKLRARRVSSGFLLPRWMTHAKPIGRWAFLVWTFLVRRARVRKIPSDSLVVEFYWHVVNINWLCQSWSDDKVVIVVILVTQNSEFSSFIAVVSSSLQPASSLMTPTHRSHCVRIDFRFLTLSSPPRTSRFIPPVPLPIGDWPIVVKLC